MSTYGKEVIGALMKELNNKVEVVTIDVMGCNREVMKYKISKVFSGTNFEKLNEDIANYADILVVIEGGKNSGTILLAAKFAEKNKNVYCVPGRINDDGSYATNWLIGQGAGILTNIREFVGNV